MLSKLKEIVKTTLKIIWDIIVVVFLLLLLLFIYLNFGSAPQASNPQYGVTFSKLFAEQLGLDWQKTYLAILDDLKADRLRLVAYWPLLEPQDDQFDFADLDWQIIEAQKRNIEVILAIGRRVPRWPECHIPDWAKNYTEPKQQQEVLEIIEMTVEHYKGFEAIKYWQIENEPFLRHFGECPKPDAGFLDKEIALVQSLDRRPIILTTSGELSLWVEPAVKTQILGTTLYRTVWNSYLKTHMTYPLRPVFYHKRANFIKYFFNVDKVFVSELAAEPWGEKQIYESTLDEQFKSMNLDKFKEMLDYGKKTGMSEFYLWGAEWWYWLKQKHDDSSMWEEAKKLWVK